MVYSPPDSFAARRINTSLLLLQTFWENPDALRANHALDGHTVSRQIKVSRSHRGLMKPCQLSLSSRIDVTGADGA